MATGISICKKCKIEFKWYRNKEQGPAKYCSKKCKDESHKEWEHRSKRRNDFTCENCGKEFVRRHTETRIPRFCCKNCMNQKVGSWCNKGKYRIKNATEDEKFQKMEESYNKFVVKQEGCWNWKGCTSRGYGKINFGKKQLGAHQASWMIHNGEIPKGKHILHKCDNRKCTNPECLWLGTHKENMEDRNLKNRAGQKLNVEMVKNIKEMLSIGVTSAYLAKKYSVSTNAIWKIKTERSWKHVEI